MWNRNQSSNEISAVVYKRRPKSSYPCDYLSKDEHQATKNLTNGTTNRKINRLVLQ